MQIRPSKQAGCGQMIGGGVAFLIGLFVVIPHMPVPFGYFWAGFALMIFIMGAVNAFSDKGIPTEEIITDDEEEEPAERTTEERLRELDDLLHKELISDAEYAETRRRILSSH